MTVGNFPEESLLLQLNDVFECKTSSLLVLGIDNGNLPDMNLSKHYPKITTYPSSKTTTALADLNTGHVLSFSKLASEGAETGSPGLI